MIDVYIFSSSTAFSPADYALLTPQEKIRASKFIPSRIGLRKILMRYTPKNPVIDYTATGKPFLKDFPTIHFNLSHANNLTLCAVSFEYPVGIDVEDMRKPRRYDRIAKRFFSETDYQTWLASKNPLKTFFELWTKHEAGIKAGGEGLFKHDKNKALHKKNTVLQYYVLSVPFPYQATLSVHVNDDNKKNNNKPMPINFRLFDFNLITSTFSQAHDVCSRHGF